ncbi:DUF6551 family protein [Clostridium botulinum]
MKKTRGVEMKKLPMSCLTSGTGYQRDFKTWRVAEIVNNFDKHKVKPLEVSYRDGEFWVYDGQHTLAALKIHYGDDKDHLVNCNVHYGLTYEDEAKLVAEQDKHVKKLKEFEKAKALYESGDYKITKIKQIVEQNNMEIPFTAGQSDNKIIAIKKIRYIYEKLEEEYFRIYIKLLKDTWHGEMTSLKGAFLGGFFRFYNTYKDNVAFNRNIFIDKLSPISPMIIMRDASIYTSKENAIAKIILSNYNKNQRKNRLEDKF